MIKRMLLVLIAFIFALPPSAICETYWVSPSGAATWANCKGETPLSGTAACSLTVANNNATAGATIYLRKGTYTQTSLSGCGNNYSCGIFPKNRGTAEAKITYSAYDEEAPVITANPGLTTSRGITIMSGTNQAPPYIRVTGITFHNLYIWAYLYNYASYNEIDHCTFYSDTGDDFGGAAGLTINSFCGGTSWTCFSKQNWIHHNTFSKVHQYGSQACHEGADMIRIGHGYPSADAADNATSEKDDYNTVENNVIAYAGHALMDTYGGKNVIKNNIMHNEGWFTDSLGSSISSIVGVGGTVTVTTTSDHNLLSATVIKVSGTTNFNGAHTATKTGANTFTFPLPGDIAQETTGTLACTYPPMANGKYGHRGLQTSEDYARSAQEILVEGNRFGFSSANPNNPGEANYAISSSATIVRHNYSFGAYQTGIGTKWYRGFPDGIATALSAEINSSATTIPVVSTSGLTISTYNYIKIGTEQITCTTRDASNFSGCTRGYNGTAKVPHLINTPVYVNAVANRGQGGSGPFKVRIYNNTSYWNGQTYPYMQSPETGCSTCPGKLAGFNVSSSAFDVGIKNNIAYDNYSNTLYGYDITVDSGQNPSNYPNATAVSQNWCTTSQAACAGCCSGSGDPKFVNPDITDPASLTLPNLALHSDSGAIDGGTFLTQAVGSGTNSTLLVVTDAMYFQDGTWGSSLARGVTHFPDWIAIGTVGNVAQIISIDYGANTITLASPMSWTNGASIWLYRKSDGGRVLHGTAPDLGAYEYPLNEIDTEPPTVLTFTISATTNTLIVPVSSFTATDNVAVTGYLVNESSVPPSPSSGGWSGSAPASYTTTTGGVHTLYAWAKDVAGNVSASRSATVTITLPEEGPADVVISGGSMSGGFRQ